MTVVMRSIHLPLDVDAKLRGLAFNLKCSKAELIRYFVKEGMDALIEELGNDPEAIKLFTERLAHDPINQQIKQQSDEDLERMRQAAEEINK